MRPRSRVLHQCTIVLPLGGQPMPLTQPLSVISAMIANSEPYTASLSPKTSITAADSSSPSGMNQRGLLRSETEPIRNFDAPYAIESPVIAVPSWAFVYSGCSARMSGIASAKFLRTR